MPRHQQILTAALVTLFSLGLISTALCASPSMGTNPASMERAEEDERTNPLMMERAEEDERTNPLMMERAEEDERTNPLMMERAEEDERSQLNSMGATTTAPNTKVQQGIWGTGGTTKPLP